MFTIDLAGLSIKIDNKYPYVRQLCGDYIVTDSAPYLNPDIEVCATDEQISLEADTSPYTSSLPYSESICIYRAICSKLPDFDAFLLHAAVIEVDGLAYAFAAPSGTGKTTHITLWKKFFGDRANIINGDKPIIRFENGTPYIYGTPWCGKEGYNINTKAPLAALCFIERSPENTIHSFEGQQMIGRLMGQILLPHDADDVLKLASLLDRTVRQVPCYLLGCNMDVQAAEVAYNGMRPGGTAGGCHE